MIIVFILREIEIIGALLAPKKKKRKKVCLVAFGFKKEFCLFGMSRMGFQQIMWKLKRISLMSTLPIGR